MEQAGVRSPPDFSLLMDLMTKIAWGCSIGFMEDVRNKQLVEVFLGHYLEVFRSDGFLCLLLLVGL